ncbi:FHA domain-containing protein [Microbacterium sp. KUDC0406]|uniref:FHA domain-containing protein n=1 Tax=Microbacterium sp. KUDC0406 TaxID=2909588 RepID=UPI003FA59986
MRHASPRRRSSRSRRWLRNRPAPTHHRRRLRPPLRRRRPPTRQHPCGRRPAAPSASVPRAVLVLDTGERIEVRATVLIGRSPKPADGEGSVQLVPLADDSRSVSKTHLAIMPTRRGLLAVDRGSTNGSAVLRDGDESALVPGQPQPLNAGDGVRFGDRTLRVDQL